MHLNFALTSKAVAAISERFTRHWLLVETRYKSDSQCPKGTTNPHESLEGNRSLSGDCTTTVLVEGNDFKPSTGANPTGVKDSIVQVVHQPAAIKVQLSLYPNGVKSPLSRSVEIMKVCF
jgi:hypothetical protein